MEAIKQLFTPEFRNRLDAIIQFKALDPTVIIPTWWTSSSIELEAQLEEKSVTIEVDDCGARSGWPNMVIDPKMGARPMARIIQEHVKKPLAEELLFGRLAHGGYVVIRAEDGQLSSTISGEEEEVCCSPRRRSFSVRGR